MDKEVLLYGLLGALAGTALGVYLAKNEDALEGLVKAGKQALGEEKEEFIDVEVTPC